MVRVRVEKESNLLDAISFSAFFYFELFLPCTKCNSCAPSSRVCFLLWGPNPPTRRTMSADKEVAVCPNLICGRKKKYNVCSLRRPWKIMIGGYRTTEVWWKVTINAGKRQSFMFHLFNPSDEGKTLKGWIIHCLLSTRRGWSVNLFSTEYKNKEIIKILPWEKQLFPIKYIEDITWPRWDIGFLFERSTRYRTTLPFIHDAKQSELRASSWLAISNKREKLS